MSAVGGTALRSFNKTGFCAKCFAMLGDIFSSVRSSAASFSRDGVEGGGDLRWGRGGGVTSRDCTLVAGFMEDVWPFVETGARGIDGPAPADEDDDMGMDEGGREEGSDGREEEEGGLIG